MDIALLLSSCSLACFLPITDNALSSISVRLTLGLSCILFSLSIIDIAPTRWQVLLTPDDGLHGLKGHLSMTRAYVIMLWSFTIWVSVILPSKIASNVFRTCFKDEAEVKFLRRCQLPWWIRYCCTLISLIFSIFYRILMKPLIQAALHHTRKQHWNKDSQLILPSNSHHNGRAPSKSPIQAKPKAIALSIRHVILGGSCSIVVSLIILRILGPRIINIPRRVQTFLSCIISWLCSVGLLLSSILNGFGSVSMPYSNLVGIFLEPLHPEILSKAEEAMKRTKSNMEEKILELNSDTFHISGMNDLSIPRRRGPFSRLNFMDFNSDQSSRRRQVLHMEIDFLDTLIGELAEDIADMKFSQDQAEMARTCCGRIRSCIGFLFSFVLLTRLYMAIMTFIDPEHIQDRPEELHKQSDPITSSLLWLTGHHLVSSQDYNLISQGVSLLLTAALSVSQVRMFLRTITAVNRRILLICRACCIPHVQATKGTSLNECLYISIYQDVLALFAGCYFLSCVIITKMTLPVSFRSSFTLALGGADFIIITPITNFIFCISAGTTAMILSILFGIQKQNAKRYIEEEKVAESGTCVSP
jgi:golgi pH regulator